MIYEVYHYYPCNPHKDCSRTKSVFRPTNPHCCSQNADSETVRLWFQNTTHFNLSFPHNNTKTVLRPSNLNCCSQNARNIETVRMWLQNIAHYILPFLRPAGGEMRPRPPLTCSQMAPGRYSWGLWSRDCQRLSSPQVCVTFKKRD